MLDSISQNDLERDYGPRRLVVELTNICNLHCNYCLRDEDALYHAPANFLAIDLFARIIREAREVADVSHVMFTGGEVTLHPKFGEILSAVREQDLKCSFITNGWNFDRVWPAVRDHRDVITHVAFSLDGATPEAHDSTRGAGSFKRIVSAFARCRAANLPFIAKTVIRRDTIGLLEPIAIFAARLGAGGVTFVHLLPTLSIAAGNQTLSRPERVAAEQEIAALRSILKINVTLDVGYIQTDPAAPCAPLAAASFNLDYQGRLSLCCNLSGYRGATRHPDLVADLRVESFAVGYARFLEMAKDQVARRAQALRRTAQSGSDLDLNIASPCLFCLQTFGKMPWNGSSTTAVRALPVISATA